MACVSVHTRRGGNMNWKDVGAAVSSPGTEEWPIAEASSESLRPSFIIHSLWESPLATGRIFRLWSGIDSMCDLICRCFYVCMIVSLTVLHWCSGNPTFVPNNRGRHAHHVQVHTLRCYSVSRATLEPHWQPHSSCLWSLHWRHLFLVRFVELRTWGRGCYWESFKWVKSWMIDKEAGRERQLSS